LQSRLQSDPLLLRYAIAATRINAANAEKSVEQLSARFDASQRRGERVHLREEARFMLHVLKNAKQALDLAKQNWQVQKEPADARILVEAAIATRDTEVVASMRAWQQLTHLEDAQINRLLRR
jgi:uncharacterized protein (DUF305 family)